MSMYSNEDLIDFFKKSKRELRIGLQNFQGIRQYTQIPLAPITLLYGQNSAGKSTIHDALDFIHNFLGGKWSDIATSEYLNRWANHNRGTDPLTKGYLGNFDDVVISVSSFIVNTDYHQWEGMYYKDRCDDSESPAYVFFDIAHDVELPLQIDMHFSNRFEASEKNNWHLRKLSLYLGSQIFIELNLDENNITDFDSILKLNKQHLVYAFIDSWFKDGLDAVVKEILVENSTNDQWLSLSGIEFFGKPEWENLICWNDIDLSDYCSPSDDTLKFRGFLASLLAVPALAVFQRFDFLSIPPLRHIPTRQTAIIRKTINDTNVFKSDLFGWANLASHVFAQHIFDAYPIEKKEDNIFYVSAQQSLANRNSETLVNSLSSSSVLDNVNRILSHPLFLNTEYEITGECFFLTPLNIFKESKNKTNQEMQELLEQLDSEVHLKLRHKSTGRLIEIEDVGVGISQIIPVLVAIELRAQVFIQQPELHLHPKLQAQIADAFVEVTLTNVETCHSPCFIIESHSEHFMLRLLRRIRETNKSDIQNKLFSLYPKDVSVLYVDKLEDGSSKIFPLRISPDGEFIDRWPNGFFTERDGELFDE